jgi:metallophosphoesterase (TIGR00282 family)
MRVLCIGDVFGRPGREALAATLPGVRRDRRIDLVIANGENSAHGAGMTVATAQMLFAAGVDVITGGNHTFHRRDTGSYLQQEARALRPLNYPPGTPGHGSLELRCGGARVLVLNAIGRLFMKPVDDPFRALEEALALADPAIRVIVVDFHAEATSEKRAMGFFLDGRASIVFGTHTHVPTADAQILPHGTAYVTDVGMVGTRHSVIGMEVEPAIESFRTLPSPRADNARGPVDVNALLVEIDPASGRSLAVTRLDYPVE